MIKNNTHTQKPWIMYSLRGRWKVEKRNAIVYREVDLLPRSLEAKNENENACLKGYKGRQDEMLM